LLIARIPHSSLQSSHSAFANKRLLEVSKNKQNGRHFKTEISLNPVTLDFVRKYNQNPIETVFEAVEENKDSKAEIPEMDL
jgi:hypothetical protein